MIDKLNFIQGLIFAGVMKDYFTILQLPPHATLTEIKQAYRRLAMLYHPDKSRNDQYADEKYNEIREAYEVLTNPIRKDNYLQELWYFKALGKKFTNQTVDPVSVLKWSLELERYVSGLDFHRMNKPGLFTYVHEMLSGETIQKLRNFNESAINRQIINTILMVIRPLPLQQANSILIILRELAQNDDKSLKRINEFYSQHKREFLWNRYEIITIIFLTLLICFLIYLTSK